MSMGEDHEIGMDDFEYEETDSDIFEKYLLGMLFWKTKDGKPINVKNMGDSHILNCLRIPLYPNKENWDIVFKFEIECRAKSK